MGRHAVKAFVLSDRVFVRYSLSSRLLARVSRIRVMEISTRYISSTCVNSKKAYKTDKGLNP